MRIEPQRLMRLAILIKEGSFSKAAAQLNLTQPALSQTIAQIEREVGVKVVERTPRGVQPTEYGQILFDHAQAIDRELSEAARQIRDLTAGRTSVLRVGTMVGGATTVVAAAVSTLQQSHPGLRLSVREVWSNRTLVHGLRDGAFDVVIGHRPPGAELDGLESRPLFRSRRLAGVRPGHPICEDRDLRSLSKYPFVCPPEEIGNLFGFPQILSAVTKEMPELILSDSIYFAKELVLCSNAFGLFSDISIARERDAGLIDVLELGVATHYWMQVIVRRDQSRADVLTEFRSELVDACRSLNLVLPEDLDE